MFKKWQRIWQTLQLRGPLGQFRRNKLRGKNMTNLIKGGRNSTHQILYIESLHNHRIFHRYRKNNPKLEGLTHQGPQWDQVSNKIEGNLPQVTKGKLNFLYPTLNSTITHFKIFLGGSLFTIAFINFHFTEKVEEEFKISLMTLDPTKRVAQREKHRYYRQCHIITV